MDRIRLGWGLCRVDFLVEVEVEGERGKIDSYWKGRKVLVSIVLGG